LTSTNVKTTMTANYIDNCFLEWTNEHDPEPGQNNELSFGGLTITGNIFTCIDVASWFRFLVIKPAGPGHFLQGLNVSGNTFKAINGNIDRVDYVDTTYAELEMNRMRNVIFEGNAFNGVAQFVSNPVQLQFDKNTDTKTWVCDFAGFLPFGGWARNMTALTTEGQILDANDVNVAALPYAEVEQGPDKDRIHLVWPQPSRGRVQMTARMDNAT
ncbi:MAG: right-handed parallel beta-helix repeat-containing protein, partial [Paracoccaceae bacterium]